MKIENIIYLFILGILFSCSKNKEIDGNYFFCRNGGYVEVYFKKDSMRIASENPRIKLSEWRKINIINDTLYFETFGEMSYTSKAGIKYIGKDKIELHFMKIENHLDLWLMQDDFNSEDSNEFWDGFHRRKSKYRQ